MITIAIDGPSAAGKSTTAKKLSEKLNILHLNTGALYRALAYHLVTKGVDIHKPEEIENNLADVEIGVSFENGKQLTLVNGVDVTAHLYNSQMGEASSLVSSYTHVREKMLDVQRNIAKNNSVIMEGRDIGSKVLPNAKFKFFLVASAETRAKRRIIDLQSSGETIDYEKVLEDIKQRDYRDTHRDNSPLIKVEDAIEINSDNLTLDEVVDKIYQNVIKG